LYLTGKIPVKNVKRNQTVHKIFAEHFDELLEEQKKK
jgi:hypothetical protein